MNTMNRQELVQNLRDTGITFGLCQAWQKKLRPNCSMRRLIELYIRGIDFCIKYNYPTLEFIRDNFKGKCEKYGVYVDDNVGIHNISEAVINGNTKGSVTFDNYAVGRLHIRHNSAIKVDCSDFSYITIDLYDDSELDLATIGNKAHALVYLHDRATVRYNGNGIKIVDKRK